MRYHYFPGCSLKGLGRAYDESLRPVMERLGVELAEIDDWNCCGATAYMSTDHCNACALGARNIAIAESSGPGDIVAPCNACYLALNKTRNCLAGDSATRAAVQKALAVAKLTYTGTAAVRHPLEVLVYDVGINVIKRNVVRPLKDLKIAPYYGCQLVRPHCSFDDQWNPTAMDRILTALGARVVDFPLKTRCCGGSLTGTAPEAGLRLTHIILGEAQRRGADLIATICPLCQFNLDSYHDQIARRWGPARIPAVYITQLMGMAFGLPTEQLGLKRNFLPADKLLAAT